MAFTPKTLQIPRSPLTDSSGKLNRDWETFLGELATNVSSLGNEKYFELTNNQVAPTSIEGLAFNYKTISHAVVDVYIQRVTTSTGATELVESGTFYCDYKPTSNSWQISGDTVIAGVTFTIASGGQVQYVSTNITGTPSISKITFRARTTAAKNSQYSEMGR